VLIGNKVYCYVLNFVSVRTIKEGSSSEYLYRALPQSYASQLCLHRVVGTGVFVVGFALCVLCVCLCVLCVCVLYVLPVLWRVFGQAVPAALAGIPAVMRVAAGTHGPVSGVIANSLTHPGGRIASMARRAISGHGGLMFIMLYPCCLGSVLTRDLLTRMNAAAGVGCLGYGRVPEVGRTHSRSGDQT
jgi:hypothetical protein